MKDKKAYPCLTVSGKKKNFDRPSDLADFIVSKMEPSLTFVKSRTGQRFVDKEVRKVGKAFEGFLEDRKIKEPSALGSVLRTIRKAEAAIRSSKKTELVEKSRKALVEIKEKLKGIRVELKTVTEELANVEKKRSQITYELYSLTHMKFLTRKNELEVGLSGVLEDINEKVMRPLKTKM